MIFDRNNDQRIDGFKCLPVGKQFFGAGAFVHIMNRLLVFTINLMWALVDVVDGANVLMFAEVICYRRSYVVFVCKREINIVSSGKNKCSYLQSTLSPVVSKRNSLNN